MTEAELNHFIEKYKEQYSVQKMCEVLTIPRSSYYHSFKKTVSNREQENQKLTKEIQRIHLKSRERYGALSKQWVLSKSKACSALNETGRNSFNYEEEIPSLSVKRKGGTTD